MNNSAVNYRLLQSLDTDALSSIDSSLTPSHWKADWLLSKFEQNIWAVKTTDSVKTAAGRWTKTTKIYFTDVLPNGQALSDTEYDQIRETIKKILFLSRQGFLLGVETRGSETTRSQQLLSLCKSLKMLIKWMILYRHKPSLTGFQSLTPSDIYDFSKDCLGGSQQADGTAQTIERFLNTAQEGGELTAYLKNGRIDLKKISSKLGLYDNDGKAISLSYYSQAKLHHFETKPLPEWLFSTRSNKTEYPASSAVKFADVVNQPPSKSLLSGYLKGFKALGYFSSLLPELHGLEWASEFSPEEIGNSLGFSEKGRTKTIPIETALEYLDHAIFWITDIAPALLTLKQNCDEQLEQLLSRNNSRKDQVAHRVKLNVPEELSSALAKRNLAITRYNRNPTKASYSDIRNNLSVEEAAECVVAASYILIGTFTCKRISEVLSLTRNCIRPALDGGSELVFGLRKASPTEALSLVGRPVPDIVRTAVELLADFRLHNTKAQSARLSKDPLFLSTYNSNRGTRTAVQMSEDILYRVLEQFADVVQISPIDGKRWYLRTHELRRFFAITYFWHDRFSNLPALTWFMGHTDPEMTMRYVTEVIAGMELPEEEARFIVQAIKDNKTISPVENLAPLRALASEKFNTVDLSIVEQNRLETYIRDLFTNGYAVSKHKLGAEVIYFEEHANEQ